MPCRISRPFVILPARVLLLAWITLSASAATKLPAIFADHMVLQRGDSTPVWGRAPAGQQITVSFSGQTVTTFSNAEGQWQLELKGLPANAIGTTLTVKGDEVVEYSDVVVGDVWLASGQSNMAMTVASPKGMRKQSGRHPIRACA